MVGYAKFELARRDRPAAVRRQEPGGALQPPLRSGGFVLVRPWRSAGAGDGGHFGLEFRHRPARQAQGRAGHQPVSANVRIDRGSEASIDMSYTEAADVYIGDVSSQVYEFLRRPRPCIFVNLGGVDWRGNDHYAHWHLGQVIERAEELRPGAGPRRRAPAGLRAAPARRHRAIARPLARAGVRAAGARDPRFRAPSICPLIG